MVFNDKIVGYLSTLDHGRKLKPRLRRNGFRPIRRPLPPRPRPGN
ncbi:hypothetical protein D3OALGA1CA_2819 [Olavius algarvensis associated proteobacterium Delta 3]|nr:hypothetical protein D3OALGA1CA_2819 [Olavius algarvensis associated proteobacterium Delta 3]